MFKGLPQLRPICRVQRVRYRRRLLLLSITLRQLDRTSTTMSERVTLHGAFWLNLVYPLRQIIRGPGLMKNYC